MSCVCGHSIWGHRNQTGVCCDGNLQFCTCSQYEPDDGADHGTLAGPHRTLRRVLCGQEVAGVNAKTGTDLLEWDVAGGATNTARPLTPSLDCSKEGLAVDASRRSDAPYGRPEASESFGQLEFDLADVRGRWRRLNRNLRSPCAPYDGPENSWREKAVTLSWIQLGIDRATLSWPTPDCGTPLCLNFAHLTWESPRKLEYPAGICVYCGILAGTKDHLLPRTWTGEAVRRNVLTVPACVECNSTIHDLYAPSITLRREVAHAGIIKRNKRILGMPEWSHAELTELGPTLRSCVEKGLHQRKLTRCRLNWPDVPDYDLRVMQLSGIENPYELGLLLPPKNRTA